jgi:hypothetical protein
MEIDRFGRRRRSPALLKNVRLRAAPRAAVGWRRVGETTGEEIVATISGLSKH